MLKIFELASPPQEPARPIAKGAKGSHSLAEFYASEENHCS